MGLLPFYPTVLAFYPSHGRRPFPIDTHREGSKLRALLSFDVKQGVRVLCGGSMNV